MSEKFQTWAIVEVMGHQTYAGYCTAEEIAGQSFIRLEVPATGKEEPFCNLFNPSSLYAITPVSEQVARLRAQSLGKAPMSLWDLPEEAKAKLRAPTPAIAWEDPEPDPTAGYYDDDEDD